MKLQEPLKTVQALVGPQVLESKRCCGESGTRGVTRPDVGTQIRFRLEEELRRDEARLRAAAADAAPRPFKVLTGCPICLQGLARCEDDLAGGLLEADYIVVEMARRILGPGWLEDCLLRANSGGIERVLI